MFIVTGEEMKRIDKSAIERYGIPSMVLMENAGSKVAQVVLELKNSQCLKKVIVVAGKGNNGGDGMVIARHLVNAGLDVKVFLLGQPDDLQDDTRVNYQILRKMAIPIIPVVTEKDLNMLRIALVYADAIVDAIFGTGFQGAVTGIGEKAIQLLNKSGVKIIAVDIPSGLESSTGKVHNVCIKAFTTVTLAYPKVGLYINQGADFSGQVIVVDISIPRGIPAEEQINRWVIEEGEVLRLLPKRHKDSHKGSYGHVLAVAGSPGMTGAAYLCCEGAFAIGAGLVSLAIPKSLNPIMEQKLTETMTLPMPETGEGTFSKLALEPLLSAEKDKSVLMVGPGLSQQGEVGELVQALLQQSQLPLVVDADGLNAIQEPEQLFNKLTKPCVITPHPGELSRLLKISGNKIQNNRIEVVIESAQKLNCTVVLKGHQTVVANPQGKVWINLTGNPGMATAGTGDVLTGIIAGLISQGLTADQAAVVGVYLHGKAGDLAALEKGMHCLKAGDLLVYLPAVIKNLEAI